MPTEAAKDWHHLRVEEALDRLGSHAERGLDPDEARDRLARFGPNAMPEPRGPGALVQFLLQFHQPLVYILIACGVVSALFHDWIEAVVILGVVLVNAVVGFVQESKATKALAALAKSMTTDAVVVRGGDLEKVDSENLVPGDVVVLQSGDKVPADLRLLQLRDLQVNESALTGESTPVEKRLDVQAHDVPLSDRANMAYSSSLVTYGSGRGLVVATGEATEMGRISQMIASAEAISTPLTRTINRFSGVLFYGILGLAALTFAVGLWRADDWRDPETWIAMFQAAVALAVGAVPEALPAAVTATLAVGVARMARRHAIIRKLPAVEALGSTTVICSDKTGTLTENQITVREIWAGEHRYEVSGIGFAPTGELVPIDGSPSLDDNAALRECLIAGTLSNEAGLDEVDGRWQVRGDPTEGAMLCVARKGGLAQKDLQQRFPRRDSIPFESQNQYSATLHDSPEGGRFAFLKGAAEVVVARCSRMLVPSGELAPVDRDAIARRIEEMAGRGMRVLAVARRDFEAKDEFTHADLDGGFTLLGLQAMIDPPRDEAMRAVAACQSAGIRVKMITGDHALTASAIAEQVGIGSLGENGNGRPRAVTGRQLAETPDDELIELCEKTDVFARVSPEQKLRLVRALQARGHVVAMTGDGVNDAPALKQADIGVAMGRMGTEVAKEAADMVLTDDNFATIEAAVEEGRGVFDNITKFIVWTLPTNLGDGLVIMAAIFAGVALPILPLQILWINMNAAVLLGLVLAFETKEPDIMVRMPRDPKQPILTRSLIERIILVGAVLLVGAFGLFWRFQHQGLDLARTLAVNFFVFVQIFYAFNCRSLTRSMLRVGLFSNPWFWLGVGAMVLLQIAYTHTALLNRLFQSVPMTLEQWALVVGLALLVYPIVGFEKWLRARMAR